MQLGHRFLDRVPGDADPRNVPRQVYGACWSAVNPTPVRAPALLAAAPEVARDLDVDPEGLVDVLAGNRVPAGARPWACCYGGHQFGHWAGQLGDGRAIVLGERDTPAGTVEVQLKGAGPTPYARTADGRAVLRSSIREFICSEAMYHLGVPTTRALSIVTTGDDVVRDMFYDGRAAAEPGAIVCRVAESFLRFGSYEIHAARGDVTLLGRLVDATVAAHFPTLVRADPSEQALALFDEVARRTTRLVAHWQRVGFVHGVLNTDNMSIHGLTIDYGPYGWLEAYDPAWTPNTTDAGGRRYAYGQQPHVIAWNLARLAEALLPLVGDVRDAQSALDAALARLRTDLRDASRAKLGWVNEHDGDDALADALVRLFLEVETDWTRFYRRLARVRDHADDARLIAPLLGAFYAPLSERQQHGLAAWCRRWLARTAVDHPDPDARERSMNTVNPRVVPRNWIVHQAIEATTGGDRGAVARLLAALRDPYADGPDDDPLDALRPEWARVRAGCSMLSCSS